MTISPLAAMALRAGLMLVLIAAASRAVLVSWADYLYRQGNAAAVQKAARILPSHALYRYTNALLLEQNEPDSPRIEQEFAAAVSANPRNSDALLAWSVEKELRGDKAAAEKLLLQSHSIDHLVRPAWALANFYYRQGNIRQFLAYSHESLRVIGVSRLSEGRFNPVPIFQLLWQSGASPADILQYAIPDVPVIRDSYLTYLLNTSRASFAPAAAARILPYADKGDLYFLRPYINYLIAANQMELASQTWKQCFARGVVPYAGPDRAAGRSLTNGALDGPPLDFGFDWRRISAELDSFEYSRVEHAYRFAFDGAEPEQFGLLTQAMPIEGTRTYTFTARFETDFNAEGSGLRWSIRNHKSGQPLTARTAVNQDGDAKMLAMEFNVPAGTDSIDLTFAYGRQPGTARIRGFYKLLRADLKVR